jgi:metal-dependent amidase/aminoacylase/carboxypeptidase family protein
MLEKYARPAASDVGTTNPDLIVFGCTSAGSLFGLDYDAEFCATLGKLAGCLSLSVINAASRVQRHSANGCDPRYVPDIQQTAFIADVAADFVGEAHVDRNRSLGDMREASAGAYIVIGNAGSVGSCPVHNPHYDFNDDAPPIGASLFARLVEKKLQRISGT